MRYRALPLAALLLSVFAACSTDRATAPSEEPSLRADTHTAPLVGPAVVISQIYGGGGNAGATFTHDFVELFNRSGDPVDVTGWTVQYASAAGNSWNSVALTGTIAPGGYFLVQQAAGAGGTQPLPTPDATGSANMSATAGKVVLALPGAVLTAIACPTGPLIVDRVGFGVNTTENGCESVWGNRTPSLSNTTAALRAANGCTYTGVAQADFDTGTPAPRNASTAPVTCGTGITPEVARVEVAPTSATLAVGGTTALVATAFADDDAPIGGVNFDWTVDNESVATVSATGVVTAVAEGTALVTATTSNGTSASAVITVEITSPPPADANVVISQIYGGGGNSGATWRNDFIELFNAGDEPVNLNGWSVQYASANGTSWQVTPLTGTIAPGRYVLVQQAAGAGGSVDLPTPDVIGTIPMAAGSGKVLLASVRAAQTGSCPTGDGIVDRVGFGSSNCGSAPGWGNTPVLGNTTAALRQNDGCVNTGVVADDFVVLAPVPRNSASPRKACVQPPREQSDVTLLINELMGDPASAESASFGEWFEVYNFGSAPVDLQGFTILSGGTSQPPHVINRSVIVPAFGYAVLGRGADPLRNGGLTIDYNYFVGTATTIWLDDNDFLMLLDGAGARVDSVAWTSLPRGVTKALSPGSPRSPNVDAEPWKFSNSTFGDGDYGTPGALNSPLALEPPFVSPNRITISGRSPTDAPLLVGFETQLFATLLPPAGASIPSTFIWQSLTPSIASVDDRGVIRALAPGLARFRVTADDGTTRSYSLPFETPVASTVTYGNHLEFGAPTDADPSDDFIVNRREFVSSFNGALGIPNWVAYQLDGSHIVPGQDRCNCFTFDPLLEQAGFTRYTTADYTGAGAFAGYGIDRGHLARSFDRTAGSLDNARSFYFSNIVPQAADVNQGPWAQFEIFLGDLARFQDKELFIYTGVSGSLGTLKDEGRITIPAWNWKVAVVVPRGRRLPDITRVDDLDVFAVVMPNRPGIRNDPWQLYSVTVDSVEALSNYDLLSLLRDDIEIAIESGTRPPMAVIDGPFMPTEWSAFTVSGAGSSDPDGDALTYSWSFGDGAGAVGETTTHTYTAPGNYTVRLIVTDPLGLADTAFTTAHVRAFADGVVAVDRLEAAIIALRDDGRLRAQDAPALFATLRTVRQHVRAGRVTPALNVLNAFGNQLDALLRSSRIRGADYDQLVALSLRVKLSIQQ